MLHVDTRWQGQHGIGRFAREVISRLPVAWVPLTSRIGPSSPLDAITPERAVLGRRDVVYSPGYSAGITRATQIVTVHDLIHLEVVSETSRLKQMYYEMLVKPAIVRARTVLTVSETSRVAIEAWLGKDGDRVSIVNVGNGCSDAFSPDGQVHNAGRPYWLYVGNLREHKNFDVILRALVAAEDAYLIVVASAIGEVSRRARALGVDHNVAVVSGLDDMDLAALYRGATALLFPSVLEGFGLPALEAISCGTPVVFWRGCASVAEIVGPNGIAVDNAGDAVEWASAMSTISAAIGSITSRDGSYDWDVVASKVARAVS